MLDRLLPWTLGALGVALALACHKPIPPAEQDRPSAAFERYHRMYQVARSLERQVKRGMGAKTARRAGEQIEQELIELEPGIVKLPKTERPYARRYVDQTLSLLEEIRDILELRGDAAAP